MNDIIIIVLSTLGTLLIFLAAVGIVKMPDLYLRISVTTKAVTLGVGLILASSAVYFNEAGVVSRVIAIILFIFLTAPIGAHMIGRASYFRGIGLWKKSVIDDLKGMYEKSTHTLKSDDKEDEIFDQ
ncbi:MAG: monovalent cation/H(+) antiporter subunit G [Cyclobacteriaceae bacterium]|nr:monovalent cation/H(+) antiporter subunit G [Cyclobacteriaceae bacterium]